MSYFKTIVLGIFALAYQVAQADFIEADFRTTKGDFTVNLDYVNAPLAVANFIQLAGKPDDILETRLGVPDLGAPGHNLQPYLFTNESDVERLPLTVSFIPATSDFRAYFGVYQNQVLIGGVETSTSGGFHRDITGQDRIRLSVLRYDPTQYRITLRYPRPWLDARDQTVKEAPMYRVLKVHRVETGKRFFAGGMTDSRFEHPGYHFQDELVKNEGNFDNPFGVPFNSSGVLAMESNGPNRNGCRFFITSVPAPDLNGRHTVIGAVPFSDPLGLAVVRDIADTPLNDDNNPSEDMVIIDITFRRGGNTANAFMEGFHQQYLPGAITPLSMSIDRTDGGFSLLSAVRPQTQTVIYSSTDLLSFEGGTINAQPPGAVEGQRTNLAPLVGFFPKFFFKGFATELPTWPSADLELENARFYLEPNSGTDRGFLRLFLGSDGTSGTYNINMEVERTGVGVGSEQVLSVGSGGFSVSYDSSKGPFEGVLSFTNITGPLNAEQITLHFDSSRLMNNPQANQANLIRRFSAATTSPDIPFLNYNGVFQKLQ